MESGDKCPVCKDVIINATTTDCNHTFCGICLEAWFRSLPRPHQPSCPLCRQDTGTGCFDAQVPTKEYDYLFESMEIFEVPKKPGKVVWTRIRHHDTGDVHFAAKVENILQCYFIAKSDNELSSSIFKMNDWSFITKLNDVRCDIQSKRDYDEGICDLFEEELVEMEYLDNLDFRLVNHASYFNYNSDGEEMFPAEDASRWVNFDLVGLVAELTEYENNHSTETQN